MQLKSKECSIFIGHRLNSRAAVLTKEVNVYYMLTELVWYT